MRPLYYRLVFYLDLSKSAAIVSGDLLPISFEFCGHMLKIYWIEKIIYVNKEDTANLREAAKKVLFYSIRPLRKGKLLNNTEMLNDSGHNVNLFYALVFASIILM